MARALTALCCLLMATASALPAAEKTVTFESLVHEMTDRARLARLPDPDYTCGQFSSYDRRTDDPSNMDTWFANRDWSHYIRKEQRGDRTEWVMMDAEGPGSIVRFWMAPPRPGLPPQGTVRIYLDGEEEPAIAVQAEKLFNGSLVGKPLSAVRSVGRNLYLPIPYAEHCKVTYDRNFWAEGNEVEARAWHLINYRTYPNDVTVETFSLDDLEEHRDAIQSVQETLLHPAEVSPQGASTVEGAGTTLEPGRVLTTQFGGPAAVCRLSVELDAMNLTQALRSTILRISFDGRQTVWCPVGDFFGSGVGLNPYQGWYAEVDKSGRLTCYWVMPFRESCEIGLENVGRQKVTAELAEVGVCPWEWDERSMYFHAGWRSRTHVPTQPRRDFNYVKAGGKGVYVGDTLTIFNRAKAWWGEGDEKIFVDGEDFPSHFGTGTEDYYGYSFGGTGGTFDAPFHAMPYGEGNDSRGYTVQSRTRSLDAIPFDRSLDVNMEVWHWRDTEMDYAAATQWYARPGATCNLEPDPEEAAKPVEVTP